MAINFNYNERGAMLWAAVSSVISGHRKGLHLQQEPSCCALCVPLCCGFAPIFVFHFSLVLATFAVAVL